MPLEIAPELRPVLARVKSAYEEAEPFQKKHRKLWDEHYGLYRSYQDFRASVSGASPRDKDKVLSDGQSQFGRELFIPFAFSTVETIVPRMLSNDPRMLILPQDALAQDSVENMKMLIDMQQAQARYSLKSQDTAKSGLIYGLGVQKGFWRKTERMQRKLVPGATQGWVLGPPQKVCVYDDPDAEDVDIFDFFWDPFGYDSDTLRYAIHRTWRPREYVLRKLEEGAWGNVTPEQVESLGTAKMDEVLAKRRQAAGVGGSEKQTTVHEVWEYHDGVDVITVLDGQVPVMKGENPAYDGRLPFHLFRPTTAAIKQVPGIGEVEPIKDLQWEMNELRTSRRDNARFTLHRVFAYSDGMIDPADMQMFPGAAWPVSPGGDPRELLFPLPVQDIPFSGYQEEDRLSSDIDRTSGISDTVTGGDSGGQTATGVQLVQAAASLRIQNKTRRFELETMTGCTRQWVAMNQVKIIQRPVMQPQPPQPGEATYTWEEIVLTPEELAGNMRVEAEAGSTQPDNVPQKRQDATFLDQMFSGHPNIDQKQLALKQLELMDVKDPETWITQEGSVPPQALQAIADGLKQMGMQPQAIDQLIGGAVQQATAVPGQATAPGGAVPSDPMAQDQQPQDGSAAQNGSQAPQGAPA